MKKSIYSIILISMYLGSYSKVGAYMILPLLSTMFFIFLYKMLIKKIEYFSLISFQVISYLLLIAGTFLGELGFEFTEIKRNGHFNGATIRCIVLLYFFLRGYFYTTDDVSYQVINKKIGTKINETFEKILIYIYLCGICFIYYNYFSRGIFFVTNRVAYNLENSFLIQKTIILLTILSIAIGIKFNKQNKLLSIASIFLYMFYLKLTGSKFTEILMVVIPFLIPLIINNKKKILKNIQQYIFYGVLLLSILIYGVAREYSKLYYKGDLKKGFELIIPRITNQAPIFYFTDLDSSFWINDKITEIKSEFRYSLEKLSSKKAFEENQNYGLNRLAQKIVPKEFEEKFLENSNFSGGFPATILYYFGSFLSFFILFMLGKIYKIASNIFIVEIKNQNYIEVIILWRILIYVSISVFVLGDIAVLLNYSLYQHILEYILYLVIFKKIKRYKKY